MNASGTRRTLRRSFPQLSDLFRKTKWFLPPVFAGLVFLTGWLVPTQDFLILPGQALETSSMIRVESRPQARPDSHFFLVTVFAQPANLDEWLFGHFYPHARLAPAHTQLPPNTSYDAFRHMEQQMMTDSQTTAKVVALRQLGYTVPMHGQGAAIRSVEVDSPAGKAGLRRGEVIVGLDGKTVESSDQLVQLIRTSRPGSSIRLTVNENGGGRDVNVELGARPDNPAAGYLGVSVGTVRPSFDFPVKIDINSQGIIGPSAGLVLTLSIIQQLSPTDITHGQAVAATGTIDMDGHIGPIGDAGEKIVAAAGKAKYFLVPQANYEEAAKQAHGIKVVEVDTLQQALDFLRTLG